MGGRWRGSFARMVLGASAQPHRVSWGAGGVVIAALFLAGLRLPVSLAMGLVVAIGAEVAIGTVRTRRLRSDDAALALALSVLEAELAAGAQEDAALHAAAAVSGRHGRQLREAAACTSYGSETADVLARSSSLRPLSAAWRVRHACGAPLAEVVAQVAQDVDLRRRRQLAVNSALAGSRSSSALLAALPVVGIGLGMAMGAHPLPFLFASNGGSRVLLVGVGLDVAGWLWTAAMVRRASR
jgi:tight adherence protein B